MCLFCETYCDICRHHYVCQGCHTIHDYLERGYCQRCHRNYFRDCATCGVNIHSAEGHFTNSSFYCSACAEEYACAECGSCDECSEINNQYYCEDCINENFRLCHSCADWFHSDEAYWSEVTEEYYCSYCYNEQFFTCDGCGGEHSYDDYARDGYCTNCYNDDDEYREVGSPIISDTFDRINSTRCFGIEIETNGGEYSDTPENWGIRDDGSISGKELVSPIMSGDAGIESIEELYRNVRPTFDRRCGIHVHVDMRDLSDDERFAVIKAFKQSKKRWFDYVDSSRHSNSYCCSDIPEISPNDDYASYTERAARNRYVWLNLDALYRHRTIEIRLLEGSSNAGKVVNWVVQIMEFVEAALNVHRLMNVAV
jgi:hypothetical protein